MEAKDDSLVMCFNLSEVISQLEEVNLDLAFDPPADVPGMEPAFPELNFTTEKDGVDQAMIYFMVCTARNCHGGLSGDVEKPVSGAISIGTESETAFGEITPSQSKARGNRSLW